MQISADDGGAASPGRQVDHGEGRENFPARCTIPVMIGGGGEAKKLRMVAQYADESN